MARGKQFLKERLHELLEVLHTMRARVPVFGGSKRIGVCPRLQPGTGFLVGLLIFQSPLDRIGKDNALPQSCACAS
jgi:hypothetical protein